MVIIKTSIHLICTLVGIHHHDQYGSEFSPRHGPGQVCFAKYFLTERWFVYQQPVRKLHLCSACSELTGVVGNIGLKDYNGDWLTKTSFYILTKLAATVLYGTIFSEMNIGGTIQ